MEFHHVTRRRKLRNIIATAIAAFGVLLAVAAPASADTGAGGLTILHASNGDQAHKCNVIGGANREYKAVVCADLVTYEGATDYYVYARAEAICEVTKTGQVVPCATIEEYTALYTGDGATSLYSNACGSGYCPNGRLYESTRNWVYKIANAGGGTCSSSTSSSYQVWGIVQGVGNYTEIVTPDGYPYFLDNGNANDGENESTGHYFVCP